MDSSTPTSQPEPQPEQEYEEYSRRMERLGQFRVDNLRNDLAGIFRGFGNFYPGKFFPLPWRSIINILISLAAAVYAVIDLSSTSYESTDESLTVLVALTVIVLYAILVIVVLHVAFSFILTLREKDFWKYSTMLFVILVIPSVFFLLLGAVNESESMVWNREVMRAWGTLFGITALLCLVFAMVQSFLFVKIARDLQLKEVLVLAAISLLFSSVLVIGFTVFSFQLLGGLISPVTSISDFMEFKDWYMPFFGAYYFSFMVFDLVLMGWVRWRSDVFPRLVGRRLLDKPMVQDLLKPFMVIIQFLNDFRIHRSYKQLWIWLGVAFLLLMAANIFPKVSGVIVTISQALLLIPLAILIYLSFSYTFIPQSLFNLRVNAPAYVSRPIARSVILLGLLFIAWWVMHTLIMTQIDLYERVFTHQAAFVLNTEVGQPNILDFGFYAFSLMVNSSFAYLTPVAGMARIYVIFVSLTSVFLLVIFVGTALGKPEATQVPPNQRSS